MNESKLSIEAIIADARVLADAGNLTGAVEVLRKAIAANPADARLHLSMAAILRAQRKFPEAVDAYVAAIALDRNAAEPNYDLATLLMSGGHLAESIPFFRKTIALEPMFPDAYVRLAAVLQTQEEVAEAIDLCRRALDIDPEDSAAHQMLGVMLISSRSYDVAEHHLKEGVRLATTSENADALRLGGLASLAALFGLLNRKAEAVAVYDQMLAIAPDQAKVHEDLAWMLLSTGDFARGWKEYEWRWKCEPLKSEGRDFGVPEWDGSSLEGRTILLHCEQGLGDTIQFCRYVPLLKERGAKVVLICQPSLRSLMSQLPGVDVLISTGDHVPRFDAHAPLLNIPGRYGTHSNAEVPAKVPYLTVPEKRIREWGAKLGIKRRRLRIGLVWAGNPGHPNDAARSIPLGALRPFKEVGEDVEFFSLQKKSTGAQVTAAPFAISNLAPDLNDFVDTAAVLMNLDLLITVDTAVAHLAGALGRPVWTLLPFRPDWRWQFDREDSPWYPTMRLFRQPTAGDWDSVLLRVAEELQNFKP